MLERWAREHERAFLTTFLALVLAALVYGSLEAARDGDELAVACGFAAGLLATLVGMLVRHRVGKLILRRVEDRRRQQATNERMRGTAPLIASAGVALVWFDGVVGHVALAALTGVFVAGTPLLLWIAFVLRPDQHPDEDL